MKLFISSMNRIKTAIILIASAFTATAQDSTQVAEPVGASLNPGGKPEWIFGIHGVVSDDDGQTFKGLFNVSQNWNFNPYPSRVSVERTLNKDWRIEAAVAYIKYAAGKVVNDNVLASSSAFIAIDVNAKYKVLNFFHIRHDIIDPYTVSGIGFAYRAALLKKSSPTVNLGLGCNFWLYKDFGLNLQTTAKFKLNMGSSNYLMHSVGVVYRLNHIANGDPKRGAILEIR